MKKIKFLLLIGCMFFFIFSLQAKKVTIEKAEQVAKSYAKSTPRLNSRKNFNVTHIKRRVAKTNQLLRSAAKEEEAMYYVFGMDDNQGFVIVSADDITTPVLGYSENGRYDESNPNFNYWTNCLAQEIAYATENNLPQDEAIKTQWDYYLTGHSDELKATTVGPLLKTQWNQGSPYNDLCPGQALTGCVATTMAQIMKYYNHPVTRTVDIPAYTTRTNEWLVPEIPGPTTYDWASMTDTYDASSTNASKTAVATLMFHCGASAYMNYTANGSGSYTTYVESALKYIFDYDYGLEHKWRRNYPNKDDWEALLRTEIDAERPVCYGGTNNANSGHVFVCDGYDDSGKFHFNWGWSGYCDGYFVTAVLNPGTDKVSGSGTWNENQNILINVKPVVRNDEIKISRNTHISASKTTLERGEPFIVNTSISNAGSTNFTGDVGVAIVDNTDKVLSVIGQKQISIPSEQLYFKCDFTCVIPLFTTVSSCRIRIVYRPSGTSEWTIVTGTPGYTDVLNLTIADPINPFNPFDPCGCLLSD